MRFLRAVGIGVVLAGTAGAAALAAIGFDGRGQPSAGASTTAPPVTSPITRTTLARSVTVEATLDYGAPLTLAATTPGTLTWLPPAGSTVTRGEAVLRADDLPVVLLHGPLPMYRQLSKDLKGADVRQFERNLRALGYLGFTVDDEYSVHTEAAVKRWQKDLGRPESGKVDVGAVLYTPGPVRVAKPLARLGAPAAGDVLTYTGTDRTVTAQVQLTEQSWAKPGAPVTVLLPDGRKAGGKVSAVGAEVSESESAEGAATPTAAVTVVVSDQAALRAFDRAPVQVSHVVEQRRNVLTVPVAALLALAEGGYGLEIREGGGTRITAVQVGMIADGRAEVRGPGLAEEMPVVVPQ
ncbi:peptidoglycan-binding protein [Paractinoplanes rishiriensis]|nr:peptidoglycan-binding protein [Actinoplanes rishiriensis]